MIFSKYAHRNSMHTAQEFAALKGFIGAANEPVARSLACGYIAQAIKVARNVKGFDESVIAKACRILRNNHLPGLAQGAMDDLAALKSEKDKA